MKAMLVCLFVCLCVVAALPLDQEVHLREPRSPQDKNDGGWNIKTDKTRNGGTVVQADAQKKWDVTKDGRVQAEVHGHWDRTYGGPNNGQRDHGVGGSVGGSWGK